MPRTGSLTYLGTEHHRVVAAFEAAIARVHDEPGAGLSALHEGRTGR